MSGQRNTARWFVENRQVAWVILFATLAWGVWGYERMPKRKDPDIPIRVVAAVCTWPGETAERVERLVVRRMEQKIADNGNVEHIFSVTRNSDPTIDDIDKEFDDIKIKLDQIQDLPQGTGPIQFLKDFRDTSALMLTVASPPVDGVEVSIRADALRKAVAEARAGSTGPRATLVVSFPHGLDPGVLARVLRGLPAHLEATGAATGAKLVERPGFVAVDANFVGDDASILAALDTFVRDRLALADLHPDVWDPVVVRDLREAEARIASVAGPRYTYRELDDFTDRIARTLEGVPLVAKVARSGVLPEAVYLTFSQERR